MHSNTSVAFGKLIFMILSFLIVVSCSPNSECGHLNDKMKIPWIVGIYIEQENDNLELTCLGTVVMKEYVVTASQCVCETFSKDIRKEKIYISTQIMNTLKAKSSAQEIKPEHIHISQEYQGFLLDPIGDLAILKAENSNELQEQFACVDWSDLTRLIQGNMKGILPAWENKVKTLDTILADYDLCMSSTSVEFGRTLSTDKNCFKSIEPSLGSQTVGSGVFYRNPKNGLWYLEGVVSASESTKDSVYLAATSIRKYLNWLSRICAH